MTALQGIWARGVQEYRELEAATVGPCSEKPEHLFCQGYFFGVTFGLALATVRQDLVEVFEPQYRERGWLDEHDGCGNA